MANPQSKEEKERFMAYLERLGEDTESEEEQEQERQHTKSNNIKRKRSTFEREDVLSSGIETMLAQSPPKLMRPVGHRRTSSLESLTSIISPPAKRRKPSSELASDPAQPQSSPVLPSVQTAASPELPREERRLYVPQILYYAARTPPQPTVPRDPDETETPSPISMSEMKRRFPYSKAVCGKDALSPPRVVIDLTSPLIDLTSPVTPTPQAPKITMPVSPTLQRGMKRGRPATKKAEPRKKAKKNKDPEPRVFPEDQQIFKGLKFFFIPNDDVAPFRRLRYIHAAERGGTRALEFDETVTHVVCENNLEFDRVRYAFPDSHIPDGTVITNLSWFEESRQENYLKAFTWTRFRLRGQSSIVYGQSVAQTPQSSVDNSVSKTSTVATSTAKSKAIYTTPQKGDELDNIIARLTDPEAQEMDLDSDDDELLSSMASETGIDVGPHGDTTPADTLIPKENKGFQCMEPHTSENDNNPNADTITQLQEMATIYDKTGDKWRTTAYRKAIGALRKQKTLVSTKEEAFAIPCIGERLAEKIAEIATTKTLRRLEYAKSDSHLQTLELFMGIYGVGHTQASQWIMQGHRTLQDLVNKADLTVAQLVGIEHYDDFAKRIPRRVVEQHGRFVGKACRAANPNLRIVIGGSYRRGSRDSGDIDLLIMMAEKEMPVLRHVITRQLLPALEKLDYLKCTLSASGPESKTGSKWMGAVCLPDTDIWRRLDILFVPWSERGAALLYFTGNDIFNRSMRLLASKKGMRLNQHGLFKDVARGKDRKKLSDGTLLEGEDERRIFEHLGVPWREPHERKC